ncbi:VanZ family protein [Thiothrix lacustris]|uniref:VanZ family protein n=1 Tax=Thiothrix lacustris TaxID=525917 RepID=UPI0027E46276|nr:VanZ family protein [Thiothrix lacustris]WMP15711.1 VanZ family protein [Thiothrix lacustris]
MQAIFSQLGLSQPQTRLIMKFLFVGLALLGIGVALLPGISTGDFPNSDKFMHAGALFGFAVLLDWATPRSFWGWKVPVLLGYGAFIELLQALTTWRSASLADFAADAAGVLLYWLLWRVVLQRFVAQQGR